MAETTFYTGGKKKIKPVNDLTGMSKNGGMGKSGKVGGQGKHKWKKRFGKGAGIIIVVVAILFGLAYFFAFRPAYALLSNINTIKGDIAQIQQNAGARDLVALNTDLDTLEKDLEDFRTARNDSMGWAKNLPGVKHYYADSDHFINAGLHIVDAGREILVLIVPFADAGGFKVSADQEVQEMSLVEAFSSWIAIMPQIANDLDPALNELTLAGEALAKVDASRYPENFRGQPIRQIIEQAQSTLTQLNAAGPDIKKALVVIPPLLGVGGDEKRYMIIMQNDKEIRPTGGFWTYFSTFRLVNAMLASDFTSYGTYNIDFTLEAIDPYYTFPAVPQAYRDHLKVERMFARDANISPDLPTSLDQFDVFWSQAIPLAPAQFKPVDGIGTIDTVVLEELLEVTGPVTLNGVTYSADTVTLELEKIASLALAEQADRKKILGDLMEAMLVNVFESDKNLWPKLIDKGIDLARRKHIQVWVFDPEAQQLLETYNLGGRIVDPVAGDYAMVVSSNLGGGKTNSWFVNKTVDHKLEREGDRYVRIVDVNYTYGEKGPEFDPFKVRYQDWVRLYAPAGSELISVDGSEDPASQGEERGKNWFGGYVTVAPGESKTVTFKYYLPEGAVGTDDYNLYIQKQSGINSEKHTVTVSGKTTEIDLTMDEKVEMPL